MTKAKTTKSAASGKKTESAAKTVKKTEPKKKAVSAEKIDKKPPEKKPAKEKTPDAKTAVEKKIPETNQAAARNPVLGFSNSGLGVKVSSRKPALAVAPGAMILGRPVQTKTEPEKRPSERRLSKKEQQDIKSFLLEKKERLLAGMRRELAMQKERALSKVADEVDKATDAYDEDLSFEIAVANDQELEEIQVALEKIERGTYGECEICGCGISPSRLKILPSATTCVSCRGQEEMARRRDDGSLAFSMLMGEDGEMDAELM